MALGRSVGNASKALGRVLRDLWLISGAVLVLCLLLEGGSRLMARFSRPAPSDTERLHPYAAEPWWPELKAQSRQARRNRIDPYRGHWPRAIATRHVNVDSAGFRRTVAPAASGPVTRRVWMLGGSTLWGFTMRDSATIPSLVATALAERGVGGVEVRNLAQTGYNGIQELITLELELGRVGPPTVAVFFHGYNDVATAAIYGEPGHTYTETETEDRIELSRRGFGAELVGLSRHSHFVGRLRAAFAPPEPPLYRVGAEQICGRAAAHYVGIADLVDKLAAGYGFEVIRFEQPVHSAGRKPLSAWEESLPKPEVIGPCMRSLDSAMRARPGPRVEPGPRFVSLIEMFDQDTGTVYVDDHAHLTEAAARRVADRIAEAIVPLVQH